MAVSLKKIKTTQKLPEYTPEHLMTEEETIVAMQRHTQIACTPAHLTKEDVTREYTPIHISDEAVKQQAIAEAVPSEDMKLSSAKSKPEVVAKARTSLSPTYATNLFSLIVGTMICLFHETITAFLFNFVGMFVDESPSVDSELLGTFHNLTGNLVSIFGAVIIVISSLSIVKSCLDHVLKR